MEEKGMLSRLSFWLLVAAVFGALLRVSYLSEFSASPLFGIPVGPDVGEYDEWARGILSGSVLWNEMPIHAPLYPFFLAGLYWLTDLDLFYVRALQLGLNLLALIGLGLLLAWRSRKSESSSGQRLVPWLFLFLALFWPLPLYHEAELISESLLLPLLCLSIALLCLSDDMEGKGWKAFCLAGAGFFAGLAVITHPLSLIFAMAELVLLGVSAWKRARLETSRTKVMEFAGVVFFLAAVSLPVLPVCLYNSHLAGRAVFVQANGGFNVYLGNNPKSTGGCYLRPGPAWEKLQKMAEAKAAEDGVSKDAFFLNKTFDFIVEYPGTWLWLLFKKALLVWNWREYPAGADVGPLRWFAPMQKAYFWTWGIIGALALTGLGLSLTDRTFLFRHRHFILLGGAFWLGQVLTVTSGRYRLAMLPALLLLAAYALSMAWEKRNDSKKMLLAALCLLFGALVVSLPRMSVDWAQERAEADSLLGEALLLGNKPANSLPFLRSAAEGSTFWARNTSLLGLAYSELGDRAAAQEMFLSLLAFAPKDPLSWMNMGVWNAEGGKDEEAKKCFEKALSFAPRHADSLYNLALLEIRNGEASRAEKNLRDCLSVAPWHRKALNALGVLLLRTGRAEEASLQLERAVLLEPRNPRLLVNLAAARLSSGEKKKAESILKKALLLEPGLKDAQELLKYCNSD